MKTTVLLAALLFAGGTPALACDYHATHTTAADENATVVVCDTSGCHALETSTAFPYLSAPLALKACVPPVATVADEFNPQRFEFAIESGFLFGAIN